MKYVALGTSRCGKLRRLILRSELPQGLMGLKPLPLVGCAAFNFSIPCKTGFQPVLLMRLSKWHRLPAGGSVCPGSALRPLNKEGHRLAAGATLQPTQKHRLEACATQVPLF